MNMHAWRNCAVGVSLLALSDAAFAHPFGHVGGFMAGVTHPLSGLDHLIAAFAVGVWAMRRGGHSLIAMPLAYVAAIALGITMSASGIALPFSEIGIAASVMVFGFFISIARPIHPVLGISIVALFAMCHGYAHGAETIAAQTRLTYATGLFVATAALLGLGIEAGRQLRDRVNHVRSVGATMMLSGLWFVLGVA